MAFWKDLPAGQKGTAAELLAIVDLIERGFEVYRAIGASSSMDLVVVGANGEVKFVEVTNGREKNGVVEFKPHSATRHRWDCIAIVTKNSVVYLDRERRRIEPHGWLGGETGLSALAAVHHKHIPTPTISTPKRAGKTLKRAIDYVRKRHPNDVTPLELEMALGIKGSAAKKILERNPEFFLRVKRGRYCAMTFTQPSPQAADETRPMVG